jgi:hypothetical protein
MADQPKRPEYEQKHEDRPEHKIVLIRSRNIAAIRLVPSLFPEFTCKSIACSNVVLTSGCRANGTPKRNASSAFREKSVSTRILTGLGFFVLLDFSASR